MRLELVTAPAAEPLSLAEAKLHLRMPAGTSEDTLVTRLISAARRQVEALTRRMLITQHWRVYYDGFPGSWSDTFPGAYNANWSTLRYPTEWRDDFVLPDVAPVSAIDSLKYVDVNGTLQTLASSVYQLVAECPARLTLAYNQAWPDIRGDRDGVRIEVTSGYGTTGASVPEDMLAAMLLIIGHLYNNREEVNDFQLFQIPAGAQTLLSPYVVPAF